MPSLLPPGAPTSIIDCFVQLEATGGPMEVPMARELLRDEASLSVWPSTGVAGHLFRKDEQRMERDAIMSDLPRWLDHLADFGIDRAQVPIVADAPDEAFELLAQHADRIFLTVRMDPHQGMRGVKRLFQLAERYPAVRSVSLSPFMTWPQLPPNSKEYYPIYAACVQLDLAVFINVGMPGPRVPGLVSDPILLEEVCWFFPELHVVMRHGGEPWVETCVKMLLRWPNLWYATTAFAPRYYPRPIIDLLNTRGRDRVIYAGYWPMLGFDRLFTELAELPIRPDAWENFLVKNAEQAFRLPGRNVA